MKIKILFQLSAIFFITGLSISEAFSIDQNLLQNSKALNLIIHYLNTESQRSVLLPSYLYKYNLEVKKHIQQKNSFVEYGPAYFSSHKNYILPQQEFEAAMTEIKNLPTNEKMKLKSALEEIHQLNINKQQLINELHKYAKDKVFLNDHFQAYFILHNRLTDLINKQKYETIILYSEIKKIYNANSSETILKPETAIQSFTEKIVSKTEINNQLQLNFSWIKNDSLLSFYTQSFNSLETDTSIFYTSAPEIQNPQALSNKYKYFWEANKNWENYYLWLCKNSSEQQNNLEHFTQLVLLYNKSVNYFNLYLSELQKNEQYKNEIPQLMALEFPMEYFEENSPPVLSNAAPTYIAFLIDASISMGNSGKLDFFTQNFNQILNIMRPEDHVALLKFNTSPQVVLPFTSGSKKVEIASSANSIKISGTTDLETGLKLALDLFENTPPESNKRILLISDGIYTIDEEIFKLLRKNKHKNIKISTLYFGSPQQNQSNNLLRLNKTASGNFYQVFNEPIILFLMNELNGL